MQQPVLHKKAFEINLPMSSEVAPKLRNGSMKKRHEELVHMEFEDWLKHQFPGKHIPWVELPPTEPRPDWYTDLNGLKYAIEATNIVSIA